MAKRILLPVLAVSLLCNVLAIYWYLNYDQKTVVQEKISAAVEKYPLLSQDILTDLPQDILINFYPLRNDIRKVTEPWGDTFGVYFEYMPTGTSIAINANNEFYAASLFKLPVIMAYYHGKERTKDLSDPTIEIKPDQIDKEFGDLWQKGAGTKLKASEAVQLALEESDNTAIKALLPIIDTQDFNTVYNGLDIDLHTGQSGALISVRNYSSILKALHFSSVLSKNSSEELLEMLTRTPFNTKIVAGVPQHIKVAHKIGDFRAGEKDQGYRDCGIVYEPRRPYIICMFSVGDEKTANQRMSLVSKRIYDYVSRVEE